MSHGIVPGGGDEPEKFRFRARFACHHTNVFITRATLGLFLCVENMVWKESIGLEQGKKQELSALCRGFDLVWVITR
jgi:hypothetical protein